MSAIAVILLAITVGSAGTLLFIHFRRNRRTLREPAYHTRCLFCKRRFHYWRHQIGHKGMCTRCRRPLVFPAPSPDDAGELVRAR
jgi:hypothetical protein